MSIKSELVAIQKQHDGILYPAEVVAWASKNKKSALYGEFEWNDSKAARAHRLWQARHLIKLHIVTEDGEAEVVSLRIDQSGEGGYRRISDVLKNEKLSLLMLQDALEDLERVRTRYQRVKELTSVWDAVENVKRRSKVKAA